MKKIRMVLMLGLFCMLFGGTVYANEAMASGEIVDITTQKRVTKKAKTKAK